MSPQPPTSARRTRQEDDGKGAERAQLSLATSLLAAAPALPHLGGPPKNDEEKRAVLEALVHLKSVGKTNKECASALEVSERSIVNYLNDPLFDEIQQELQGRARSLGHTTIAGLIPSAIAKLAYLVNHAQSEFVGFKAAETLLNFAGYNLPPQEQKRDNLDELTKFLEEVKARRSGGGSVPSQVNVNVSVVGQPSQEVIVESTVSEVEPPVALPVKAEGRQEVSPELAQYYQIVQPGGFIPGSVPPSQRGKPGDR